MRGAAVARGGRNLLRGVDLCLESGESLLLLGPSGSGKTTLLRLLRGELPPTAGERLYHLDGRTTPSPLPVRHRVALVSAEQQRFYQDPGHGEGPVRAASRATGLEVVVAGMRDAPLCYHPPTEREAERARAAAETAGAGDLLDTPLAELSQGQARRLLLARALASGPEEGPDLLLLDECCEGLDEASREAWLAAVGRVMERGTAVVYATHRPDEAESLPGLRRAVLLRDGRVVHDGPVEAVPNFAEEADTGCPVVNGAKADAPPSFLFHLENVRLRRGGRDILYVDGWTVMPGQGWAVLGPNGAGKSSLLSLLHGDLPPAPGSVVRRFGLDGPSGWREIRRRVGLVSAVLDAAHHLPQTALDCAASGFAGRVGPHADAPAEHTRAALRTLEGVGLGHLASRDLSQLSCGQRRLVLLARALAPGPDALLLDEPLAGLDPSLRVRMTGILEDVQRFGAALVVAVHHAEDLPHGVDRVLRLEDGTARREPLACQPKME